MKSLVRLLFNYYLVFKACWAVVLFQVIGYFALLVFDQGLDVLQELDFSSDPVLSRKSFITWIAVSWWGWQSWRSSRMILHFSYFNFWGYQPSYNLRAQVLVPRILAMTPFLLLASGIYKSNGSWSAYVALILSTAMWFFVFLHFRKKLIVWIRSLHIQFHGIIPDYVPIKNDAYPAKFIWSKQWKWISFRILVMLIFFGVFVLRPISTSQYMGSAAVVVFGFGTWLILASLINMFEKYIRFPVSFTVLVSVIIFSFFNDNHGIMTFQDRTRLERPTLNNHFSNWLQECRSDADSDSIRVVLVAAEGGGIRSAYWTASVLGELHATNPELSNDIYAISSVSGGSLGTMLYSSLRQDEQRDLTKHAHSILEYDFLAPVTGALIFPDMLQKFFPLEVFRNDRARVLERSWENAWSRETGKQTRVDWSKGFLRQFGQSNKLILMNSTHVESGYRTLISNVKLTELSHANIIDFFDVQNADIPVSTAVGLSARFPLLTPPARIESGQNSVWGHLVDGGYYENIGATTIMDIYSKLRKLADDNEVPVQFHVLAIRNTKTSDDYTASRGMGEILPPLVTLSQIWSLNGEEVLRKSEELLEQNGDRLIEVRLDRSDKENIPLGWFLSDQARSNIRKQVPDAVHHIHEQFRTEP